MEYEVNPRRLGGPRWPVLVPIGIAGAAIVAALLGDPAAATRVTSPAVDGAPPSAEPSRSPEPSSDVRAGDGAGRTDRGRGTFPPPSRVARPPVRVECRDVPEADCERAVQAARGVVGALGSSSAMRIHTATVHRSLLCSSDFDCPRRILDDGRSLGSVVLTFVGDDRVSWLNVVESPAGAAGSPGHPTAIVVRWLSERS